MITPTPRGFVADNYSNHVGSTRDEWGNIYAAFTRADVGKWPELVIRRRQHGTGDWATIAEFPATNTAKYGYCALECVGAHLVIIAPERQPDGTTPQREFLLLNAVSQFAQS